VRGLAVEIDRNRVTVNRHSIQDSSQRGDGSRKGEEWGKIWASQKFRYSFFLF